MGARPNAVFWFGTNATKEGPFNDGYDEENDVSIDGLNEDVVGKEVERLFGVKLVVLHDEEESAFALAVKVHQTDWDDVESIACLALPEDTGERLRKAAEHLKWPGYESGVPVGWWLGAYEG
jgi:hypothetical protein